MGYYVENFGGSIIIFDSSQINNKNKQNVFIVHDFLYSGSTGETVSDITIDSGTIYTGKNLFYSLNHFTGTDDLWFDTWWSNMQVHLRKYANMNYIAMKFVLFYKF